MPDLTFHSQNYIILMFFSIYYLHKGFGKKSCDALQSVAIDSVSLYRYEE